MDLTATGSDAPRLSVVVPAHNEEHHLPRGLDAIEVAARALGARVEVVVVANRCTDATAALAAARGALVVEDDARNISAVRNAGVAASSGELVVTVDADCRVGPSALRAARVLLDSGSVVGGGTRVVPERRSPGILATYAVMELLVGASRLAGGMFWCRRDDFDRVGGFDESVLVGEDLDFARRLRAHGRRSGRRFMMIRSSPVEASCRKFDRFGDWHMFAMAGQLGQIARSTRGVDTTWVDRYFFDFNG